MNNLVKDLLIGLQPAHLVTLILLILLAGCDYHSMPSDVRKSLNLAGGNNKELLEVRFSIRETLVKQGGALRKYPVGIFSERARLQGWRRSTGKPP